MFKRLVYQDFTIFTTFLLMCLLVLQAKYSQKCNNIILQLITNAVTPSHSPKNIKENSMVELF